MWWRMRFPALRAKSGHRMWMCAFFFSRAIHMRQAVRATTAPRLARIESLSPLPPLYAVGAVLGRCRLYGNYECSTRPQGLLARRAVHRCCRSSTQHTLICAALAGLLCYGETKRTHAAVLIRIARCAIFIFNRIEYEYTLQCTSIHLPQAFSFHFC